MLTLDAPCEGGWGWCPGFWVWVSLPLQTYILNLLVHVKIIMFTRDWDATLATIEVRVEVDMDTAVQRSVL